MAIAEEKEAITLGNKLRCLNVTSKCLDERVAYGGMGHTYLVHIEQPASEPDILLARFKLYPMPGLCGTCVVSYPTLLVGFEGLSRDEKLALLIRQIERVARGLGYGQIIHTNSRELDEGEEVIPALEAAGWKLITALTYINPRTDRNIVWLAKNLRPRRVIY